MAKVTITIDGKQVSGHEGMTVLEVAQENGFDIPTLCHHPLLTPTGACRVCAVEDESNNELVASCTTNIVPGMVISTNSDRVIEARRNTVELLLACHPDSCLVCDKGNRCEMRRLASKLGIGQVHFDRLRNYYHFEDANPFIERDLSLCIQCGRCVRACQEIRGVCAIDFAYRGFRLKPATAMDKTLSESTCQSCGLCVAVCPVGALSDKSTKVQGKETAKIRTVCPYCGVGCNINLGVRDQKVLGVNMVDMVNDTGLCVKGRYGLDFIHHSERLTAPLVKRDGKFEEASWDEALELVARRLAGYQKDEVGVITSAKGTNEENYVAQKLARAVLGTNNVDHCARL
jgi:predicted molibdopterin-dependent oxidoreductase YjgC